MGVRLRYAPSPTGHLHIGGARTALFNYLFAKHHGGAFILRIEDTDLDRNVDNAAKEFADNLRWLGIEWDEGAYLGGDCGPYVSTERLDIYARHVEELRDKGVIYECYCSEDELAAERERQMVRGEAVRYSGRCRRMTDKERAAYIHEGRKPTLRFRVTDDESVEFTDLIRGDMIFEPQGIGGDFVVVKSNGIPVYNFAVVVDDHLMDITHVVRGEEHISNTPRQLMLFRAFGWTPPVFGHVPLILGADGKKLSKRDESLIQFIDQYREYGYLPEAIFNFLALLGWTPGGEREILTREEFIANFGLDRVNRSGAYFDAAKLAWMNGHYLKSRSAAELLPSARPFLEPAAAGWRASDVDAWMIEFIALYKDQVSCLSELPVIGSVLLGDAVSVEADAAETLDDGQAVAVLGAFLRRARSWTDWTPDGMKALLKAVQSSTGKKGKDLFFPVRAAITGRLHGPDLNRSLALLGQTRVLERLERAVGAAGEQPTT
ncbi:MAG: glutamate--tRNA ligase [Bacilli bacterium]